MKKIGSFCSNSRYSMKNMVTTKLDHLLITMQGMQCLSGNAIKLIAAACMLVDHTAKTVFVSVFRYTLEPLSRSGELPESAVLLLSNINHNILYSIGAIAFPLFCYMVVEGYQHTHSKSKYLLRIALFAIISEIPFDLAFFSQYALLENSFPFDWDYQNVFFTYFLGLGLLMLMDWISTKQKGAASFLLQCGAVGAICFLADQVIHCDYGGYGVFLMVLLYVLRKNRLYQVIGMLILPLFVYIQRPISYAIAIMIIILYNGKRGKRNLKYFFYVFYPTHIFCLHLLDTMIKPI